MRWQIHRFDALTSTNDTALAWIRAGRATAGDVLIAARQTAGRGRRGRAWAAPEGALLLTAVLPVPLEDATWSGLTAAVAVALAGRDLGVAVGVKWPNDVLVDGLKVAGVLVETHAGLGAIGIGVNVSHAPPLAAAGCLGDVAASDLERAILGHLAGLWRRTEAEGWSSILPEWERLDVGRGRRVRLDPPGVTGVAGGLDPVTGGLCIAGDDGLNYLAEVGEATFLP